MSIFFKQKAANQNREATLLSKAMTGIVTASLINVMALPAHAAHEKEQAKQAIERTAVGDNAYDKLVNLNAKYKIQQELYQIERKKKLAGRNIFQKIIDGITVLFTDNREVIDAVDPEQLHLVKDDILRLQAELNEEQTELNRELQQQTNRMQKAGFTDTSIEEHKTRIKEINIRHQELNRLFASLASSSNDASTLITMAEISDKLKEWQPQSRQTDVENLPWGVRSSDVRKPIMSEADAVVALKNSSDTTKQERPYSAIHQWRNTEYNFKQLLLRLNGQKGYIKSQSPTLAGSPKSNVGEWTVLKALPAEVQAADTAATEDVQITQAIKDKAKELDNNPAKIYKWVHDNIVYVPTYGSIQGSDYTLQTKRGNAFDTASLTIALLRASGIPSRYVYGTVDIPAKQAMDWVGGVNNIEAVQNLLGQGGVPNTAIMNGSVAKYLRLEHVWVEANINFVSKGSANNKAPNDSQNQWLPLDPSYKSYIRTKGIDLAKAVPFDAESLLKKAQEGASIDEGTGGVQNLNEGAVNQAIEEYQAQVQAYLEQNHADATVGDILGTSSIKTYNSEMLSPVLPYQVQMVVSDYQELPKSMRHYFVFNLYENVGFFGHNSYGLPQYEYKMPTTRLQGKPLSFSFRPEDEEEEKKLLQSVENDINGDLPINVWMTPELRLGDEILRNDGRFRLGYDIKVRYGFQSPNSSLPSYVNKDMVAGEYHAIGYNLQGMGEKQLAKTKETLENAQRVIQNDGIQSLNRHDTTGAILQANVQSYFAINQKQDDILSNQANVVDNYHLSFGTVSNTLNTDYRYGLPWRTRPTGITVDMDRLRHQVVSKDNDKVEQINYLQAQGLRESSNENLVPEKLLGAVGISAVKALTIASEQGQQIYIITADNQSSALAKLSGHSARTMQDVTNALNAGLQVTISERPVRFNNWQGSGYILQDTTSGTGAYMLEGGVNGGFAELIASVEEIDECIDEFIDCTAEQIQKNKSMALAMGSMLTTFYESTVGLIPAVIMNYVLINLTVMLTSIKKITECHLKELAVFLGIAIGLGAITTMIQRIGSRIPAYGLVAIATMFPMMAMASDNGMRLMRDCEEDEKCKFDVVNPYSSKQFGHAFTEHGQKNKESRLRDRAGSKNTAIGWWVNDMAAANVIANYNGQDLRAINVYTVMDIDIPPNVGVVVPKERDNPIKPTLRARVIINSKGATNCIKTAYPIE